MTPVPLTLCCASSTGGPGGDRIEFRAYTTPGAKVGLRAYEGGSRAEVDLSESSLRELAAWLLQVLGDAPAVVTPGPTPEARLEALKAAEAMLETIAPKANARGYSDGALNGPARVAEVLRLASFLLGGAA